MQHAQIRYSAASLRPTKSLACSSVASERAPTAPGTDVVPAVLNICTQAHDMWQGHWLCMQREVKICMSSAYIWLSRTCYRGKCTSDIFNPCSSATICISWSTYNREGNRCYTRVASSLSPRCMKRHQVPYHPFDLVHFSCACLLLWHCSCC